MLAAACFLSSSKDARAALPDDSRWHASSTLAAGTKTGHLILNIKEAPAPGDSIQVTVSTKDVATVLVTPSSQEITERSAAERGFQWTQGSAGVAPLGSDDFGQYTRFVFNRAGTPGQYVVNFTFSRLEAPARVEVQFTSRMKDFVDLIQQTPGARILGPAKLAPVARLSFDMPQDLENQVIEIVVPNATVTVELTLPDGRTLRQTDIDPSQAKWEEFTETEDNKPPPFFFAQDMTLPIVGTHHFIHLKDTPKGRYEIRAQSSSATAGGNLTLAVLPFAALEKQSEQKCGLVNSPWLARLKFAPNPCLLSVTSATNWKSSWNSSEISEHKLRNLKYGSNGGRGFP